jgi:ankyrin repeat protein
MEEVIEAIMSGDDVRARGLVEEDPSRARARDENGVSALMLAQYHGRGELATLLRSLAPDLDVFEAAAFGDTDRLAAVLDADAELVNRYASDGFTPLQLAAFFGHPSAVELLLERGAETNATAKNRLQVQALHSGCASPENGADAAAALRIARALLDNGADVNAKQQQGFTPLHAAAHHGHIELVRLLLERGADPRAVTDAGKTPVDVASERGHGEVAALLGS